MNLHRTPDKVYAQMTADEIETTDLFALLIVADVDCHAELAENDLNVVACILDRLDVGNRLPSTRPAIWTTSPIAPASTRGGCQQRPAASIDWIG
jgi:hypothetical protein